jgi:hypothetical protein
MHFRDLDADLVTWAKAQHTTAPAGQQQGTPHQEAAALPQGSPSRRRARCRCGGPRRWASRPPCRRIQL